MFYYKKIKDNKVVEFGTHLLIVPADTIEITEADYSKLVVELNEHILKVEEYVQKVASGEIIIDNVPEDYKTEVEAKLPYFEEPRYTLEEAAALLIKEVADEL